MSGNVSPPPEDPVTRAMEMNGWAPGDRMLSHEDRLRTILDRYDFMIRMSEPDLSETEWDFIELALAGTWFKDAGPSISSLAGNIASGADETGADLTFGVDAITIATRVSRMDMAQKVAIIERLEARHRKSL